MRIFGFQLEFDHNTVRQNIERCCAERGKGYVCIVDGPSLVRAHTTPDFLELLNGAYFNSCDGGSVAAMSSHLYKQDLRAFTGPEILAEYITRTEYRQVLVGNTAEMYGKVTDRLKAKGIGADHLMHYPLPFKSVDEFDYASIAQGIGQMNADIIWVSLGAPKQEFFMQRLTPHLNHGIMIGVGAAFAFWLGELKDYSFRIGENRFNWIYRLFMEPKKQFARVCTILIYYPAIYAKEARNKSIQQL